MQSTLLISHLHRDAEREGHRDEDEDEGEHGEEHGADAGALGIGCKGGRRKTIRMRGGRKEEEGEEEGGAQVASLPSSTLIRRTRPYHMTKTPPAPNLPFIHLSADCS